MTDLPRIAQGRYFDELTAGDRFRTHRRTITEADLVAFINAAGMLEQIFIDAEHGGAMGGRPVPAALTYCFIEGLQMQSFVQGTGLALLEVSTKVKAPVRVGDTIWAIIAVSAVRATSKGNRGIVSFDVDVLNQDETVVMTYTVTRMMAGNPARTA
ncbi:acyl dehydratase [Sphingomonas jejuensis]|uniref:Acyl dehydratase n=1 Tax=Sphingomonas jejuensis TaxID=904715 RepID=A0ABX0XI32_9SPHN|nr:MaoC family dehydratase N-terminal domain-containing protein [Sphingomonas jejuensis]NJC32880.1 acyl dehydratase [Sphingomonas jejuensis]